MPPDTVFQSLAVLTAVANAQMASQSRIAKGQTFCLLPPLFFIASVHLPANMVSVFIIQMYLVRITFMFVSKYTNDTLIKGMNCASDALNSPATEFCSGQVPPNVTVTMLYG